MSLHETDGLTELIADADPSVRPQDDLFRHVNGAWLESTDIPSDLSRVGGFIDLVLEAEAEVGEILRDAAEDTDAERGSDRRKIGDLFASFMDTEAIEALGAKPIAADLAAIEAIESVDELVVLLGRLQRSGVSGLFAVYVNTDDRRSDRYILNVVQAGLGLPDESFYREESFAPIRTAYEAHVANMLRLLGRSDEDAAAGAATVLALETRIAGGHWDKVRCRDVVAGYNLTPVAELRTLAPQIDWQAWARELAGGAAVDADEVLVRQPSFLTAASELLTEVPLEDWRIWLTFHVVSSAAPYLSSELVEEDFAFYGRILTGAEENRERWKRGVDLCGGAIGEAVGAAYVARAFPPEAKAEMDELVANLVEAYRVSIGRLEWMTPETRERALAKLEQFRSKIGYPDTWRDYGALEIDRGDLVGNVRRAQAFETDRNLAKLGGPVDRDEWLMTPQTVNAYYHPGTNTICFPEAILRPPFFEFGADPALNYGGIGAVIGHEIGHGFDDQGSQYDGEGNLVDWWTDDDRSGFSALCEKLIAQYDGFEPTDVPGEHVNGALTVGENIGDLGGLTIALLAYELSLDGAEAPVLEGLSGRERLFRNWSRIWRIKVRPELARQLLTVDVHSPEEFRANIVRNLDEFHDTFATSPEDALWLDPSERVRIW